MMTEWFSWEDSLVPQTKALQKSPSICSAHPPEQILPLQNRLQQYMSYSPVWASQLRFLPLFYDMLQTCSSTVCYVLYLSPTYYVHLVFNSIFPTLVLLQCSKLKVKLQILHKVRRKNNKITFGKSQNGHNTTAVTILLRQYIYSFVISGSVWEIVILMVYNQTIWLFW